MLTVYEGLKSYFAVCQYNGQQYKPGAVFQAIDGCGTCTCDSKGLVECLHVDCDDRKL